MLESFGLRSELCERIRSGLAGPYLDSFAEYLAHSGYRPQHGRYLHAVGHFASWARDDGLKITALDELSRLAVAKQTRLVGATQPLPSGSPGRPPSAP